MGVHGLSTFLRENKRTLAKSAEFTTHYDAQTSLVIDAWSFVALLSMLVANLYSSRTQVHLQLVAGCNAAVGLWRRVWRLCNTCNTGRTGVAGCWAEAMFRV